MSKHKLLNSSLSLASLSVSAKLPPSYLQGRMFKSLDVNQSTYYRFNDGASYLKPCHVKETTEEHYKSAGLLPFMVAGDDVFLLMGLERREDQSLCLVPCGGKRERADCGSLHTAVREFEEETGHILQSFLGKDTIWTFPSDTFNITALPDNTMLPIYRSTQCFSTLTNPQEVTESQASEQFSTQTDLSTLPPTTSDASFYWEGGKYVCHFQYCGEVEFPFHDPSLFQLIKDKKFTKDDLESQYIWNWANTLLLGGNSNHIYSNNFGAHVLRLIYEHVDDDIALFRSAFQDEKQEFLDEFKRKQEEAEEAEAVAAKAEEGAPSLERTEQQQDQTSDQIESNSMNDTDTPKQQQQQQQPKKAKGSQKNKKKIPTLPSYAQPRLVFPQFPCTHLGMEFLQPPKLFTQDTVDSIYTRLEQAQQQNQQMQQPRQDDQAQLQFDNDTHGGDNHNQFESDQPPQPTQPPQPQPRSHYMDSDDDDDDDYDYDAQSDQTMYQTDAIDDNTVDDYLAQFTAPARSTSSADRPPILPKTSTRSLLCWLLPLAHHYQTHILPTYRFNAQKALLVERYGADSDQVQKFTQTIDRPLQSGNFLWPYHLERDFGGSFLFSQQFKSLAQHKARQIAELAWTFRAKHQASKGLTDEAIQLQKAGFVNKMKQSLFKLAESKSLPLLDKYNTVLHPRWAQIIRATFNQRAHSVLMLESDQALVSTQSPPTPQQTTATEPAQITTDEFFPQQPQQDSDSTLVINPFNKHPIYQEITQIAASDNIDALLKSYSTKSIVDAQSWDAFSLFHSTPPPDLVLTPIQHPSYLDFTVNNTILNQQPFKSPFLTKYYKSMVRERFFSIKMRLARLQVNAATKQIANAARNADLAEKKADLRKQATSRSHMDEGSDEDADILDDIDQDDEGQSGPNDDNKDENEQSKVKKKQSPIAKSRLYNIESLYPDPNNRHFNSHHLQIQNSVGFDRMVSLHWVSVRSLLVSLHCSHTTAPSTRFINFLRSYDRFDPKYSPGNNLTNFAIKNYFRLSRTLIQSSKQNDYGTAVTSTGFVFPVSLVAQNLVNHSSFVDFFVPLLQHRFNHVYGDWTTLRDQIIGDDQLVTDAAQ